MTETRLLFYSEGLALAGLALAAVGAAVFWGLLAAWVVRARAWALAPLLLVPPVLALGLVLRRPRDGDPEPVLPWWQVLVGMALAVVLGGVARHAAREPVPPVQLALMVLVTVTGAVWVLFFYLRVYRSLGRWPMAALATLRVLAVVLLVLLIFKPTLSFEGSVEQRTDLVVLLDASRSMSVRDWPDTPSRFAQATQQVQDYLGRLGSAFDVRLLVFDARARPVEPGQWPEPAGEATNLVRAVREAVAEARPAETSGLVLFSDGLHNAGGDVVEAVTALAPPPIYTVGVGTDLTAESGYQDISIEAVRAPDEGVVGTVARITVDVEALGLADRSVEVRLREDEDVVARQSLRLDGEPGSQSVTLAVTPTDLGRHTYTVEIPADPAERRGENNTRQVHLLVSDPKIRVLYIEGVVRPEYKPLKSVLETDPNVQLLALVQVRKGEFLQSGNLAGLTLSAFPRTLEDMRRFDVFILGDLHRSYFSGRQLENLKTAVSEGRGLAMLGGYHSFGPGGYGGTPVEEMLPVEVGGAEMGQETEPFVLKLTPEGAAHPIFHGTTDFFASSGGTPREKLPYLKGCTRLGAAKPGASVLAVHPTRTGPGGPLVVLAAQTFGKGRTVAFAADTTYQWYLPYRALGRESPYIKFWSQMVRYLAAKEVKAESDEPGVTVLVRKPAYNPGEPVIVRAKVRADQGRATNFADVSGVLLGPGDEDREPFSLPLAAGSVGVYEAELRPPEPGAYEVAVEATKDGVRLGFEKTAFTVGRPNQEFDRLSIDRRLLKELARATGGAYFEPAAFGDLVQRLRDRTLTEDVRREVGLQTVSGLVPMLFLAFLAIVTGEWLLRKRYQLN